MSEREFVLRPLLRTAALLEAVRSLRLNYLFAIDDNQIAEAELEAEMLAKNLDRLRPLAAYDEIQEEVRQMFGEYFARVERAGRAKNSDTVIFMALIRFMEYKGTAKFGDLRREIELYKNLDARGFKEVVRRKMLSAQTKAMARHEEYGTMAAAIETLPAADKREIQYQLTSMAAGFQYESMQEPQGCELLLFIKRRSSRR